MPKSKGDLYIFPPSLTLYQKDGSEISSDLFEALDLGQLQGSFPSNEKLNITYRVKLSEKLESKPDSLKLEYIVETANIDLYAISWYAKELDGLNVFGSTGISNSQVFESATRKRLIYQERLYEKGTNPIWNDFWSNPR